jgi:hypothetical protein
MTKFGTKIWDQERFGWFIKSGPTSDLGSEQAYVRCVRNNGYMADVINYRTLEVIWDD